MAAHPHFPSNGTDGLEVDFRTMDHDMYQGSTLHDHERTSTSGETLCLESCLSEAAAQDHATIMRKEVFWWFGGVADKAGKGSSFLSPTGDAEQEAEIVAIVPPTRPCNPLTPWRVWTNNKTPFSDFPDVEERKSRLRQPGVDRMSSTTERSQNPNGTEVWTSKKRNEAIEADEARLLYTSGGRNDADAVPIARPTARPMNKPQVRVPILNAGFKPRNTLQNGLSAGQNPPHQGARGKPKGGEPPHLTLQAVRGDNVTNLSYANGSGENWGESSPKRRKINPRASSSSSGVSTDELDKLSPENVTFLPSQKSSQAVSMHSFNSQGSELRTGRRGSVHFLNEHRTVERMMSSAEPTKKQRRQEARQNQQRNHGLPMAEQSSLSEPIDISGCDEKEGAQSRPDLLVTSGKYRGTARQPPSANASKANTSKPMLAQATGKKSPYFLQPALPSKQRHSACDRQPSPLDIQNGNTKRTERLNEQFIPVTGKRRSLDNNLSSDVDELQLGTTVGSNPDEKALSSITRPRNQSSSKDSPSTLNATSPIKEDASPDPSTIRLTTFTRAEPKNQGDRLFIGPPVRENDAAWAVDVIGVSMSGEYVVCESMGLVHDETTKSYVLKKDGKPTPVQILPAKLMKIIWGTSGRKMRFMSSKIHNEENVVDLELRKEQDVLKVVSRLGSQPGCQTNSRNSEQMDRMFERRRLELKEHMSSAWGSAHRQVDTNHAETGGPLQESHQPKNSNMGESKRERQSLSVVDGLWARSTSTDAPSVRPPKTRPAPTGSSHEDSITGVLDRLKPNHNQHLRRSTRTSSEFKRPYKDLFDDLGDASAAEKYSKTHDMGEPWKKPLIYPKVGKKKATVEFSDLERLDEGEFLNDNLLSFYLRFLEHTLEEQRPDLAKRVYFFNTFFFATLMNTHKGKKGFNYEGVQKWTRNVDLFTFDYIVVPINEAAHWYLAIICNLPALDRNLSMSDNEASPQAKSTLTKEVRDPTELSPPSSSSTQGQLEQAPVNLVEDQKEPDERGARNSFAEMSLESDPKSPTEGHEALSKHARFLASLNEDKDMLDVPSREAVSPSRKAGTKGKAKDSRELDEDSIEDIDQNRREATKTKKGKRKSGPPAITKTSPDKPVIITFDSLGMSRSTTIRILKDYLREEAKAKRGGMEFESGQIKGITASQIPQQDNCFDCGVFLLGYVAKFLEDDPKDFIAKIIRREYNETKDWPNLRPGSLRNTIRDQVRKLHEEQAAERQKERDTPRHGKRDAKRNQEPHSSPARVNDQTKAVDEESRPVRDETTEETAKAHQPTQPTTRLEALETSLSLDSDDVRKDIKALMQSTESDKKTEAIMQRDQQETREEAELRSSKPGATEHEERKQDSPVPIENEPSVIYVESQSQLESSAPKSFTNSHPAPTTRSPVRKSPELPAEIQDSQPSQTSRIIANTVHGIPENEDDSQEIPIEPLANPRLAKRRKTGDYSALAALTGMFDQPTDHNSKVPNWGNQGNAPTKRKRLGNKNAHKSDEIINIDDD